MSKKMMGSGVSAKRVIKSNIKSIVSTIGVIQDMIKEIDDWATEEEVPNLGPYSRVSKYDQQIGVIVKKTPSSRGKLKYVAADTFNQFLSGQGDFKIVDVVLTSGTKKSKFLELDEVYIKGNQIVRQNRSECDQSMLPEQFADKNIHNMTIVFDIGKAAVKKIRARE